MLTKNYATGLAAIVIACAGNGPVWINAIYLLVGAWLLWNEEEPSND